MNYKIQYYDEVINTCYTIIDVSNIMYNVKCTSNQCMM